MRSQHILLDSTPDSVSRLGGGGELAKQVDVPVGDIEGLLGEGEFSPGGLNRAFRKEPSVFNKKV